MNAPANKLAHKLISAKDYTFRRGKNLSVAFVGLGVIVENNKVGCGAICMKNVLSTFLNVLFVFEISKCLFCFNELDNESIKFCKNGLFSFNAALNASSSVQSIF